MRGRLRGPLDIFAPFKGWAIRLKLGRYAPFKGLWRGRGDKRIGIELVRRPARPLERRFRNGAGGCVMRGKAGTPLMAQTLNGVFGLVRTDASCGGAAAPP